MAISVLSRLATTAAARGAPVSSASSPIVAPGNSSRDDPSGRRTSTRPERKRYRVSPGSPAWNRASPARSSTCSPDDSISSRTSEGRSPRRSVSAAGRLVVTRGSGTRRETRGGPAVAVSASSRVRTRPKNRAITAAAAKLAAASSQPWRRSLGRLVGVGWAMKMVRMAIPSTPPICRVLEFTAEAVAYCPARTTDRPPAAATGTVAPTPIPLRICPGSHSPTKSGCSPTRVAYHTYAPAQTSAPGTTTALGPKRSASRPQVGARIAATTAPGATASPARRRLYPQT